MRRIAKEVACSSFRRTVGAHAAGRVRSRAAGLTQVGEEHGDVLAPRGQQGLPAGAREVVGEVPEMELVLGQRAGVGVLRAGDKDRLGDQLPVEDDGCAGSAGEPVETGRVWPYSVV